MADIKTLAKVADIELGSSFQLSAEKLIQMLGVMQPIPAHAGETLKQKKITGTLSTAAYTEGEEIPETKYTTEDVKTYEATLKPYRVSTTIQDVQKRGYDAAITAKDNKLLADIQAVIKGDIITALGEGTATASGTDLPRAAANAFAKLANAAEENGFGAVTPVFFCNPVDFATALGKSDTAAAFGFQYLANFAGLGNLIASSKVPEGTVYCTAAENFKAYYIEANEAPGFDFTTDESGYIAVQHDTELTKLTYNTVAWTALQFIPEYVDFIVKGTIAPSE